jgi:DNA-directed RNA polymerase sigma subunit (sigma70/sigma32)
MQQFSRTPSRAEVASKMGLEPARLEDIGRWSQTCTSLDTPVDCDSDDAPTLWDVTPETTNRLPVDLVTRAEVARLAHALMGTLSTEQADIVRLHFGFRGEPMTLQAIGKGLGISRQAVQKKLATALRRIREIAVAMGLGPEVLEVFTDHSRD